MKNARFWLFTGLIIWSALCAISVHYTHYATASFCALIAIQRGIAGAILESREWEKKNL